MSQMKCEQLNKVKKSGIPAEMEFLLSVLKVCALTGALQIIFWTSLVFAEIGLMWSPAYAEENRDLQNSGAQSMAQPVLQPQIVQTSNSETPVPTSIRPAPQKQMMQLSVTLEAVESQRSNQDQNLNKKNSQMLSSNQQDKSQDGALPDPQWLPSVVGVRLELIPQGSASSSLSVWDQIRDGFAMEDFQTKTQLKLVSRQEKWYANRPDYVARMTDRSRLYLYYITAEVKRRNMPTEIALLPMIESAFNPGAYSPSRASGIWQFMPSTGKKFGMEQNWWYDGRRDIISATKGALDYLQSLHDMFGSWDLALAAYNCGEGSVQKAQARNRKRHLPTDYVHLNLLKETRNYVPKLLAIKHIIADPAHFGIDLPPIPNQPYFAIVDPKEHMDVKLAAQLAEITEEEFTALNPGNNRPVILQDNSEVILLPVDHLDTFKGNLERYNKPLVSWQSYQPKKGDRLDRLASRFGLTLDNLKIINGLPRQESRSSGQTLLVPLNGEAPEEDFRAFNMKLAADDLSRAIRHIVRRGETLSGIARHYHVTLARLRQWNGPLKIIRPGQAIALMQTGSQRFIKRHARVKTRHHSTSLAANGNLSSIKGFVARRVQ